MERASKSEADQRCPKGLYARLPPTYAALAAVKLFDSTKASNGSFGRVLLSALRSQLSAIRRHQRGLLKTRAGPGACRQFV